MRGGPSHVDSDYKPELARPTVARPLPGDADEVPWEFKQYSSGLWITELLPKIGALSDELCLLRGMHTDLPVHPTAMTQLHTGKAQFVRPSLGAWTLYGLGSGNENLPGFVVVNPAAGSAQNYGSAFLPAIYQGTRLTTPTTSAQRPRGDQRPGQMVADIRNPRMTTRQQRSQLDFVQQLNRQQLKHTADHPGIEGVIESYELAFRMQSALPRLMDIADESQQTLDLYGIGSGPTDRFGRQCLLARRLAEAGVRFIEIEHGNWDTHFNLSNQFPNLCQQIDQPIAGLLTDLKRGLLKDTLVLWAGEFGRTPYAQNGDGQDHNNKGFTTWMARRRCRGGFSFGSTDETGAQAVEGRCHIHDWHATILHLLELDHTRLTCRYAGREFRLTDVNGNVCRNSGLTRRPWD